MLQESQISCFAGAVCYTVGNTLKGVSALKRFACWMLILSILVLLMLPVSASDRLLAAESMKTFADQDQIRHDRAVMLLAGVGLISGYTDHTFRPEKNISRAETAKIIACLSSKNPTAVSDSRFSDVPENWATSYIYYCAEKGIVAGYGNGQFRPDENVTARELAKMLLVTLGYDETPYTGSGWAEAVDTDAARLGIYDGYTQAYTEDITRDDACMMVCNAVLCYAVDGIRADGTCSYVLDALMNPVTYLEVRYGVVRYSEVLVANEYLSLSLPGGRLETGYTRLQGHKDFALTSDVSLLGHNVDVFLLKGEAIGVPFLSSAEISYTFQNSRDLQQTLARSGYQLTEETEYYHNYEKTSAQYPQNVSGAKITVIDHTGDRIIDTVLITDWTQGTVLSENPLTVQLGSGRVTARKFSSFDTFHVGDPVECCLLNGLYYAALPE